LLEGKREEGGVPVNKEAPAPLPGNRECTIAALIADKNEKWLFSLCFLRANRLHRVPGCTKIAQVPNTKKQLKGTDQRVNEFQ
jgi:hypothetical protein